MKPTDNISRAIREKLNFTAGAELHQRILADALAARPRSEESSSALAEHNVGRMNMKNRMIKLAAAAVIIAAIMVGIYILTGSVDGTSITMAQVRQAMQDIDWMQIINEGDTKDDGHVQLDWFSFASKIHIGTDDKGRVVYSDFKTRKQLHWPAGSKYIYESPIGQERRFASGVNGPFEMIDKTFRLIQAEHDANVTKELGTYQDQKVEVWTIIHDTKSGDGRILKVYFDVERMLPVSTTCDHTRADGTVFRESNIEFKYPQSGPADIYEAGAPRWAQIEPSPDQEPSAENKQPQDQPQ